MHVLVTGHTGFKGAWLTLLLNELGHSVAGLALDPQSRSLFRQARISEIMTTDFRGDIRDRSVVKDALAQIQPDVIIHLAAQPLVRQSYLDPRETIETNVLGTLNVLETSSAVPNLEALLVITTDKVYRNVNRELGYSENEPLGGDDPYSASKAMADILCSAWATSFPHVPTAIARSGNVIGGGDYGPDRLVPDILSALVSGRPARLRYPNAVRPWQHVLDCLNGYLAILTHIMHPSTLSANPGVWNIGPGAGSFKTVAELASAVSEAWQGTASWEIDDREHPPEAQLLALDATRAYRQLGWKNLMDFETSVALTVNWYLDIDQGRDALEVTMNQISNFLQR